MLHSLSTEMISFIRPVCVTADGDGVGVMAMAFFRQNILVAMLFLSPLLTSITGNDLHRFLNPSLLISTQCVAAWLSVTITTPMSFVIPEAQKIVLSFFGCRLLAQLWVVIPQSLEYSRFAFELS